MSREVPYIVDQWETIVSRVNTKVIATIRQNNMAITGKSDSNIRTISYDHGHPIEIINTLQEKDQTEKYKFERLPLIALFEDFKIGDSNVFGCYGNVKLNVFIIHSTDPNYDAETRMQKSFKPILDVIYKELLIQIDKSGFYHVQDWEMIKHNMTRRMFWGRQSLYGNTANIFNDYIDAIECNFDLDVYYADACQEV